jgi:hypothetical protein
MEVAAESHDWLVVIVKLKLPPELPVVTVWVGGLEPFAALKDRLVVLSVRFCACTVSKQPTASNPEVTRRGINRAAAIRNVVGIIPIEAL